MWSPWSRFLEQRRLGELDSGDGVLPGGEGEVGEHEAHESYLWVVSVDSAVAGRGPATGAVPREAMAAACGGGPARGGWGGTNPRPRRSWGAPWRGAGRRACGPQRAAAWRQRRRHERAWKLVERDGTWRARASASREESILAVGWWKLWPRDGVRRRPEFRRNFNGDRWAGVSIPTGESLAGS